ncbi:AraC family transcriptional regulator [Halodesulfovibrio sp.]|jgi:AraC-like DNA-binding protein|uniref:AraC family transcriptional regulator n=1 Tax=Halodesulfovibrio sp. TaxID=1912772 RepID=UPI0025FF50A6|nr:AraC family transcriptional regulator [Halodesulfovibrio sp.]MCT4534688.1 AraC family transcriptional regulator [Halodesulfovibrio sp.]
MKHTQYIDTLILKQLTPERHTIGAIKDTNIVENVVWHQHKETEIIYMERAYGTFFLGDSLISFDPEDESSIIILLGSLLAHSFFYHPNRTLDHSEKSNVISILFHTETLGEGFFDLPEMQAAKQLIGKANCAYIVTKDAMEDIAILMEELCKSEGIHRLTCFLQILDLITKQDTITQITGHTLANKKVENDLLTNIIQYIHENYQEELSLRETASRYHMSVSAFCSFFKKYTGQTFVEFLNRLRISKACEKMLTCNDDITSIAYTCGFNNLSNFNRRFKQFKEESPRSYRSRYKISE